MKKVGLVLLLLVFSLAAMPAVAADFGSVNVQEFRLDETEAKFIEGEEVAIGSAAVCERLAEFPASFIEQNVAVFDDDPDKTDLIRYVSDDGHARSIRETGSPGEVLLCADLLGPGARLQG